MFSIHTSWQVGLLYGRGMQARSPPSSPCWLPAPWPPNPAALVSRQAPQAGVFRSGVDLVTVTATVRDRRGRAGGRPDRRRLRGVRPRAAPRDHGVPHRSRAGECRDPVRHQRQHATWRSARLPHGLRPIMCSRGWSRAATKPRCLRLTAGCTRWPRSRSIRVPCKVRWGRSIRSGPPLCMMPSPRAAKRVAERADRRRAVVVITDGIDTASRLDARRGVGHRQRDRRAGLRHRHRAADRSPATRRPLRRPRTTRRATAGTVEDLATWTGGEFFYASTPSDTSKAARQIVDELRQQYVIAFEPAPRPDGGRSRFGRRDKDLTVRARSGYIAGGRRGVTSSSGTPASESRGVFRRIPCVSPCSSSVVCC